MTTAISTINHLRHGRINPAIYQSDGIYIIADECEAKLIAAFRDLDAYDKKWALAALNQTATAARRAREQCRANDRENNERHARQAAAK